MKRRQFFGMAGLAGLATVAAASRLGLAAGQEKGDPSEASGDAFEGIDPYFSFNGTFSDSDLERVADEEAYLDVVQRGGEAIRPRGHKPRWAPTYRMLHWPGDPGEEGVQLMGPLSVEPQMPSGRSYRLNAQILDFHTASKRWGRGAEGALSIEFRARKGGEALTWLFAEQFQCFGGSTSLGNSFVAERNGSPQPVLLDEPNVDVRLQLMRMRKAPGILRKILNLASFIVGGGATGVITQMIPSVRIPQLVEEGVALTQALFGEMSSEKPQWLSGFNSYGVSEEGSRLSLAPGLWVVVDENATHDLAAVKLEDRGGRVMLTENGEPLDATYLIFIIEIDTGSRSRDAGIIRKGVAEDR